MIHAQVVGFAHGSVFHPTLRSRRLLLCEGCGPDGKPDGSVFLAVDRLGAGPGDRVHVTTDGEAAARIVGSPRTPLRNVVLGIIDPERSAG